MRQCPRCGEMFPEDRKVCTTRGCKRRTIEVIDWTDEDEAKAIQDLEDGIMADPFEDYEAPEPQPPKPKPKPEPKPKVKVKPKKKPKPKPKPEVKEDEIKEADETDKIKEPEQEIEKKEDLREDLKGQSDQIHDILEKSKPLTYDQIAINMYPPVSEKRVSRLVGQMIRDGVELKREGSPRKVSLG